MTVLESRYWGSFALCGFLCFALQWYSRSSKAGSLPANPRFKSFQSTYLIIFLLAMFSDWLQGPYVYELYVSYGFDQQQIAELFVCGFGSSMIFGTFIGGLADKLGRKNMCILYCLCYIVACFTKLVPQYWVLMIGRFLSGIATSLLFSSFESWMVCEHMKQGFDAALMGETFSYATFGNGLVAVVAGLVANYFASSYGFVAPFMVALVPLSCVAFLVFTSWNENYGNQDVDMMSSLSKGFKLITSDSRIAALGMGQSLFEGAMYTFVFMWTPALKSVEESEAEAAGTPLEESTSKYLGLIFAVFMLSVMVGSSIFKIFSVNKDVLYQIPLYMHGASFLAMVFITMFLDDKATVYYMFLVFEMTVGIFYPSYGVIKSEKIPEEIRSSVMNIFRVPLNGFVVLLLLKIKFLSSLQIFQVCAATHGLAFLCYWYFYHYSFKVKNQYDEEGRPFLKNGSYGRATSEMDMHMREMMSAQDEDEDAEV